MINTSTYLDVLCGSSNLPIAGSVPLYASYSGSDGGAFGSSRVQPSGKTAIGRRTLQSVTNATKFASLQMGQAAGIPIPGQVYSPDMFGGGSFALVTAAAVKVKIDRASVMSVVVAHAVQYWG